MDTKGTQKQIGMDEARGAFLAERRQKILNAADRARRAQRYVQNTVDNARDAGMTWAEVGEILGCTRQAAQQRFGH